MRKILLIIILLLSISVENLVAESFDESLRYHFIIAFDKAGCPWISNDATSNAIKEILFSERTDLLDRKSLFQNGDYISMVGFAIPVTARNMSNYAFLLESGADTMCFKKYSTEHLKWYISSWGWKRLINQPVGEKLFSLVSVAKPYSLMALKSNQYVNRTFIITITDHRYNGNDFYDELNAFQQFTKHRKQLMSDVICKSAYEVSQHYYIKYCETIDIGNHGYAELYEYVPLQRHFELSKILEYPKQIEAALCRDGSYKIEFNIQEGDNSLFKIEQLNGYLNDRVIDLTDYVQGGMFSEKVSGTDMECLKLRAWVRMTDGIYNNTILSPSFESPIECGREGLNVSIPIKYEMEMKIFNVIPMASWAWLGCFESQANAIMFWQITIPIISLLALLIFCWCAVRFNPPYELQLEDFKLIEKN